MAEPLSVVGILAVAPFPHKSYRSLDQAALPAPQGISKGRNEPHPRESGFLLKNHLSQSRMLQCLYSSVCIPQWSRTEVDGTAYKLRQCKREVTESIRIVGPTVFPCLQSPKLLDIGGERLDIRLLEATVFK